MNAKKLEACFANKWIIITGASSGIGECFAKELAKLGGNLILVARRANRLESIKKEIEERFLVKVKCVVGDLSSSEGTQDIYKSIQDYNQNISFLINNAGVGLHGKFSNLPYANQRKLLQLNINAITELTHFFLQDNMGNKSGGVLNISSLIASRPCPEYATYAASKTYVLNFTQALHYEYKNTGTAFTVLCPGPVETEFFKVAGEKPGFAIRLLMTTPQKCAQHGLTALSQNKLICIPGLINKSWFYCQLFIPKQLTALISKLLH